MEPVLDAVQPARIPVPSKQSPDDDHSVEFFKAVAIETTEVELSSSESSMLKTSVRKSAVVECHASNIAVKILEIIFDYALNKFSDSRQRLEAGRPKFLSAIDKFVSAGARVETCLPAFPFKCVFSFLSSL